MEDLPKELGVEISTLMATQGKVATEKLPELFQYFLNDTVPNNIKKQLAEGFGYWSSMTARPTVDNSLKTHFPMMIDVVFQLLSHADDKNEDGEYDGYQLIAKLIVDSLRTAGMMDTTQKVVSMMAPLMYTCLSKLNELELTLEDKTVFTKSSPATERCSALSTMLTILPYSGSVNIPNAIPVISTYLCGNYPSSLKQSAKQALQTMSQVNKEGMKHSGGHIMDIIATGEFDDLIFTFLSMPELYTNNPDGVHKHIAKVLEMNWMYVGSLVNNIANQNAKVLVPHVPLIISKVNEAPQLATVTLMILKEIAKAAPNAVYPHLSDIISAAGGSNSYLVAGVIGACSKATCVVEFEPGDANQCIGDLMLDELMKLLNATADTVSVTTILSEILNMKETLSTREKLAPYMAAISSHKSSNDVVVTSIEDFFAGRSLASLETRVDQVEARINELNDKVAESCANFEDVIAYVDAHVADLKDFIGDVVKKLPTPKRLEVVGTLRKTLILHFECVHTGYEFPIVSYEWNKWLKMGFSLAKAGKAVFDIGTGNPLGLLSTGIDCVKGIYEAYKSNDDDEFNAYITHPFLTSTEQDQLLEKLRDQGFFEKMAYDNQAPGWYLLNPEVDGTPPGGEAGGVTRVSKKEGYGIMNSVMSVVNDHIGDDPLVEMARDVSDSLHSKLGKASESEVENPISSTASSASPKVSPAPVSPQTSGGPSKKPGSNIGGRAAAVRMEMAQSGVLNEQSAQEKLQRGEQIAVLQNTVAQLESRLEKMEGNMKTMQTQISALESNKGCACTIS